MDSINKADEMLADLGWRFEENNRRFCRYSKMDEKSNRESNLLFTYYNKAYTCCDVVGYSAAIETDLHRAIQEKMKELGWVE